MISKKTKYALKALTILVNEYPYKKPILITDLAKRGNAPKKFLELILLDLKNKGILHSKKGKGGGYFLARSPEHIKLGTVMHILEGPLSPLPCLSRSAYRKCDECEDESTCNIRLIMKELHEAQLKILDGTTLQDLAEKHCMLQGAGTYAI